MADKVGARKDGKFRAVSTAPSFNKTPIGPGTPPVPYPVFQDLSVSVDTAKSVNFNGDPAYLLNQSTQPNCLGDSPGTAGGVKSGTVGGEVKPLAGSSTVKACGEPVVRELDACTLNSGNCPGIYVAQPAPACGIFEGNILGDPNPPAKIETPEEDKWFQEAWNDAKSLNREYKLVQRGLGVLNVAGGIGEMAIGVAGLLAPTGVTQIGGAVVTVHGMDTTSTGFSQVLSGEFQETATAQLAGPTVDTALGIVGPVGVERRLIREGAEVMAKREATDLAEKEAKELGERELKEVAERETREATENAAKEKPQRITVDTGKTKSTPRDGVVIEQRPILPKEGRKIPCFPAGTLVKTVDGDVPIEKIYIGIKVLSFDQATSKTSPKQVTQVLRSRTLSLMTITTDVGEIICTRQHRFWVECLHDWTEAKYLRPGMQLLIVSGNTCLVTRTRIDTIQETNTFNLSVDGSHTFFVGTPGILVHNESPTPNGKIYVGRASDGQIVYVGQTKQSIGARQAQHFDDALDAPEKYGFKKDMTIEQVEGLDGLTDDEMKYHERKLYDKLTDEGHDLKNKNIPTSEKKMRELESKYCK